MKARSQTAAGNARKAAAAEARKQLVDKALDKVDGKLTDDVIIIRLSLEYVDGMALEVDSIRLSDEELQDLRNQYEPAAAAAGSRRKQ